MTKKLLGILVVGFVMCLAARSAHAQDMGKFTVFGGYSFTTNSIDNSIELADENCDYDCGSTTGLHGYTVSGVYNFTNNIGFEANFDGHNGSPTIYSCTSTDYDCYDYATDDYYDNASVKLRQDLYTYTFGPKFTVPLGNWAIWGHVLVGGFHAHEGGSYCASEEYEGDPCSGYGNAVGNGFAFKTGGGLDWNHGHWGIRLVEVDYVHLAGTATGIYDDYSGYSEKFPVSANNIEVAAGILFNFGHGK